MGLLNQLRLWEETRLDKHIKRISMTLMGIYCLIIIVTMSINPNGLNGIIGKIIIVAFFLNVIMELKYGITAHPNPRYYDESKSEYKRRTGLNYVDNTPKDLTYWKAFKILYLPK